MTCQVYYCPYFKGTEDLCFSPQETPSFDLDAGSGSMESAAPRLPMRLGVAFGAQRDQALSHIGTRLAAELEVVHLPVLSAPASLALPAIALQHLPMQFAAAGRIESASRALAADLLHEAFRLTSERETSC